MSPVRRTPAPDERAMCSLRRHRRHRRHRGRLGLAQPSLEEATQARPAQQHRDERCSAAQDGRHDRAPDPATTSGCRCSGARQAFRPAARDERMGDRIDGRANACERSARSAARRARSMHRRDRARERAQGGSDALVAVAEFTPSRAAAHCASCRPCTARYTRPPRRRSRAHDDRDACRPGLRVAPEHRADRADLAIEVEVRRPGREARVEHRLRRDRVRPAMWRTREPRRISVARHRHRRAARTPTRARWPRRARGSTGRAGDDRPVTAA